MFMRGNISSKEDNASILYRGRAFLSSISDNEVMENDTWKARLATAIEQSGKSKRAISLASNNGPGYVHSILTEGKDPTVENLLSVCEQIPVSAIYILYGLDVKPDDLEILRALQDKPESRSGILSIIKNTRS